MYLKSIEVNGFKSFANKINFEFHNGITCIVGPNGSGKSNVADAVRWVLGEQSAKQLRGTSMQDVIFSGTENRKPQSFAYVAITLDNSDHQLNIEYDEVVVSRRVYRSGESEYKINGANCRLKDIQELFYDTGIGKEGYSIIGQGQIEKILNGKPDEKRELFDEAAGIVKFKRRKSIALKKLEDEHMNLVRVKDILEELEKQVEPLEKQAEVAKKFLKLKEELKCYDINAFLLDTEFIQKQIKENEEKIEIVQAQLKKEQTSGEELKHEFEEVVRQLEWIEKRIEESRKQLQENILEKGNIQGNINVLKEQINTEETNVAHILAREKNIQEDVSIKEKKLATLEEEKNILEQEIGAISKEKHEVEIKKNELAHIVEEKSQWIEESKSKIISLLNEKSKQSIEEQRLQSLLEQAMIRRAEISQNLIRSKSEEELYEVEANKYKKEIEEQIANIASKTHLQTSIYEQRMKELASIAQYKNENEKRNRLYQSIHTKAESLKNIAERYEGYGNSIKRIMEQKATTIGIHGVVADVIQVEKKYEIAIETALGGSIQNIVTDTEQTAKQLIEYLKQHKYGRATFLPLSAIKGFGEIKEVNLLKEEGVIGVANTLVSSEAIYEPLLQSLLGKTLVVDTIDNGMKVAKKYKHSIRIVTLEGELLNVGGSMTGGAFKNNSNLLGRKREITQLEEEAKKIKKELEHFQEIMAQLQASVDKKSGEEATLKEEIQQMQLLLTKSEFHFNSHKKKIEDIQTSRDSFVIENRQLELQIQQLTEQKKKISSRLGTISEENIQLEQEIMEVSKEVEEKKEEKDNLQVELQNIQLTLSKKEQMISFLYENEKTIKQEMKHLASQQKQFYENQSTSNQIIEEKKEMIVSLKEKVKQLEQSEVSLEKLVASSEEEKVTFMSKQKDFFEKKEENSNQISLLDRELFRFTNKQESLEQQLDEKTNYLWSEYELSPSEAIQFKVDEYNSRDQLSNIVKDIKQQIKMLGAVNINAIDDYKEVFERYTFMRTQYDDLTQAKEKLQAIIEELDTGMRIQFEEKFKEIQREFDQVFQQLFGGGHGSLQLMEGEDIIEAGIGIIAQPPGKKLQNMMQLSGGEKALTAIALLFAIQNLKPSPFCLLDEIEAALDDSNVGRFSNYLHKLTKSTQFIIITHRRGTMVSADRLYGITMQEKGVSTLVSVNLIEEQLD